MVSGFGAAFDRDSSAGFTAADFGCVGSSSTNAAPVPLFAVFVSTKKSPRFGNQFKQHFDIRWKRRALRQNRTRQSWSARLGFKWQFDAINNLRRRQARRAVPAH